MKVSADATWQPHYSQSFAFGEPRVSGRIRHAPEDFRVDEITPVVPDGAGEHLLLQVRKRNTNTDWLAGRLAAALGVHRREASFAGRKDRHAVTTQWFSVRVVGAEPPDWQNALPPEVEILQAHRHGRKLRRGALTGNRFVIVIRDLAGEVATLAARVAHIRSEGVPNYFGEQRFGKGGANLVNARAMFTGRRRGVPRGKREMILSAARAQIFNAVLARRVAEASWNSLLDGEVAALAGSNSVFVVEEPDENLRERVIRHDIHPTGPLWGKGALLSRGPVRDLESEVAGQWQTLAQGLEAAGLRQARRALRISVHDLEMELTDDTAELSFSLAPGCYATAVLRELLAYHDAAQQSGARSRSDDRD